MEIIDLELNDAQQKELDKFCRKTLDKMCLMDDTLAKVAFDGNNEAVSYLISTILDKKITMVSTETQKHFYAGEGKETIVDIFSMDDKGSAYMIELENNPTRALLARMEHTRDISVVALVPKGTEYSDIKHKYVICFTRGDPCKTGLQVSRSDMIWIGSDQKAKTGSQIIYVNLNKNKGDDPISEICRDMTERNGSKVTVPILNRSVNLVKKGEGGKKMCDMINQMNAEVKRYLNKIYQEKFDAAMTKAMNTMKEEAEEKVNEEVRKAVQEAEEKVNREVRKAEQEKEEETVINMLKNQIGVDLIGKIMNMSAESVMNVATAYGIVIEEPLLNKA